MKSQLNRSESRQVQNVASLLAQALRKTPDREKRASLKKSPYLLTLVPYKTLRRSSTSAPTPEDMSTRLAAKVTGSTSGGPPALGSAVAVGLAVAVAVGLAVAVAVGLAVAVAVAVAVGLAVMASPKKFSHAMPSPSGSR